MELISKLFKKSIPAPRKPDYEKIYQLEVEYGKYVTVTEDNFEREFDRVLIEDYRNTHGTKYVDSYNEDRRYGASSYAGSKYRKRMQEKQYAAEEAEEAYDEVIILLMLESSREMFADEFSPYGANNRWARD